jgi:hypothetical protein
MPWLETAPLFLVGLLVLLMLLAAFEIGYRGHDWLKRKGGNRAAHGGQDHLLSAVLGLLALLLGFTFSLALNRYETRRDLVLQEANAIGTTFLRAELLDEPNRTAITGLLRSYTDARIAWSDADAGRVGLTRTSMLQQQLWSATGGAIRHDSSQQLSRGLMDAMNESFDLASARAEARAAHIPDRVLHVLMLYAALSIMMLGYISAAGGRPHRIATTLLLVLLTLAIAVILDLDRPRNGAIQVSQQPLIDLRASLDQPRVSGAVK